jgi:hypothetical protein
MFVIKVNFCSLGFEREFISPVGKVIQYADSIVHVHITELELKKSILERHYKTVERELGAPQNILLF